MHLSKTTQTQVVAVKITLTICEARNLRYFLKHYESHMIHGEYEGVLKEMLEFLRPLDLTQYGESSG